MSNIGMRFEAKTGAKTLRTILIFVTAALLTLAATDSRALSENDSGGFLYSDYLQHHSGADEAFSVSTPRAPFWQNAVSGVKHSVNELSFSDILAKQVVNGERSNTRRELADIGSQFGADVIRQGALSAADELAGDWLRQIDVNIETKSGRGFSNIGLDAITSLRETDRDALAAQIHGYAGFDDNRRHGFNVGAIYRWAANDNTLLGANMFLDYETFDGNGFWRLGAGAESRSAWLDVFGNVYSAQTDAVIKENGDAIYSASGYDVEAHIHSPKIPLFAGVVGAYNWKGEQEDANEDGFLLGARMTPLQIPLLMQVDYRTGEGESLGGRFVFNYEFNKTGTSFSHARGGKFRPQNYFYAPVEREYTQRIQVGVDRLPGVARFVELRGEAWLRSANEGTTVRIRINPEDNSEIVLVQGDLDGENVVANGVQTRELSTWFPPGVSVELDNVSGADIVMAWNSRVASVRIMNNAQVIMSENAMLLRQGEVSVQANAGFSMVMSDPTGMPDAGIRINGQSTIQVRRLTGGGGLIRRIAGQFVVTNRDASMTVASIGNNAAVQLSFNSSNLAEVSLISGAYMMIRNGVTTTVNCRSAGVSCQIEPLGVRVASSFSGEGTADSPINAPLNYRSGGVIATVSGNGTANASDEIAAAYSSPLTVNENGVISVLENETLAAGVHRIPVRLTRDGVSVTEMVVVSAGAFTASLTPFGDDGVEGQGTANSPFRINSINAVKEGARLARVGVSGGYGVNYTYRILGDTNNLFRVRNGFLEAAQNLPSNTMLTIVLQVGTNNPQDLAQEFDVPVVIGAIPFDFVVQTNLSGSGTSTNPYSITDYDLLDVGAVLATIRAAGSAGSIRYDYSRGNNSLIYNVDNGEVAVVVQLDERGGYSLTVRATLGTRITMRVFHFRAFLEDRPSAVNTPLVAPEVSDELANHQNHGSFMTLEDGGVAGSGFDESKPRSVGLPNDYVAGMETGMTGFGYTN